MLDHSGSIYTEHARAWFITKLFERPAVFMQILYKLKIVSFLHLKLSQATVSQQKNWATEEIPHLNVKCIPGTCVMVKALHAHCDCHVEFCQRNDKELHIYALVS